LAQVEASERGALSGEIETGVPGLLLVRSLAGGDWRLVHQASGMLLSRAAVSVDPSPLVRLAERLAGLADWTKPEIPVAGPALRKAIEDNAADIGLSLASVAPSRGDAQWQPERERDLVLLVLRRIHTAVPPGMLASAIADLDPQERAHLRAMLTAQDEASSAVVRPLPSRQKRPDTAASTPARAPERPIPPGRAVPGG